MSCCRASWILSPFGRTVWGAIRLGNERKLTQRRALQDLQDSQQEGLPTRQVEAVQIVIQQVGLLGEDLVA